MDQFTSFFFQFDFFLEERISVERKRQATTTRSGSMTMWFLGSLLLLMAVRPSSASLFEPFDPNKYGSKHVVSREYVTLGPTVHHHDKRVVCYWATWAYYRPGHGQFNLKNINPSLCTNLVYSFVGIDDDTLENKVLDPHFDLENNSGLGMMGKATHLR